jgi:hypothetical protein
MPHPRLAIQRESYGLLCSAAVLALSFVRGVRWKGEG